MVSEIVKRGRSRKICFSDKEHVTNGSQAEFYGGTVSQLRGI